MIYMYKSLCVFGDLARASEQKGDRYLPPYLFLARGASSPHYEVRGKTISASFFFVSNIRIFNTLLSYFRTLLLTSFFT